MLTKEKKATVPFRLIDEKLTNPFLRCKDINENELGEFNLGNIS